MLSRVARAVGTGVLLALLHSGVCLAGGPIGGDGTPLETSDYAIDLYQGPVFAGARLTSLAGAYVAIAEDVDGDLQNPATPAVRPFFSYSHFDYWLGFGLTLPGALNGADFFNSGKPNGPDSGPTSFVFFTPAVNLQWGELGIGVTLELSSYGLSTPQEGEERTNIATSISTFHLQLAHGFSHNQLVLGLGARITSLSVNDRRGSGTQFDSSGNGFELGLVYKPELLPIRVGAALRTAIRTEAQYNDNLLPDQNGDIWLVTDTGQQYFLPKSVALPWDLNIGVAFQFGRPLNPRWRTDNELIEEETLTHRLRELERERRKGAALAAARSPEERQQITLSFLREQLADDNALERARTHSRDQTERQLAQMNRHYLQVSASLLVSGAVEQGVGVESFLSQVVNRSGQKDVYSPRLGVEGGVIPEWLKVRAGTYLEPTRFETSDPRVHGTFGLDLRLARWNVFGLWPDDYVWRLGLGGDAARDYVTWGFTVGGWYPRRRGAD